MKTTVLVGREGLYGAYPPRFSAFYSLALLAICLSGCWLSTGGTPNPDGGTDDSSSDSSDTSSSSDSDVDGDSDTDSDSDPNHYSSISVGRRHACALTQEGKAVCWGEFDYLTPSDTFSSIHCGSEFVCGLKTDGSVLCWGGSTYGQLDAPDVLFVSIDSGRRTSCGITADDSSALCWGDNSHGQSAPPPGPFTSVSVGAIHSCGIRTDGTVDCWGDNGDGQSSPPVGEFISVEVSDYHGYCNEELDGFFSCGLSPEHYLQCWGADLEVCSPPGFQVQDFALNACMGWFQDSVGEISYWGFDSCPAYIFGPPDWYYFEPAPEGPFNALDAGGLRACGILEGGTIRCWGICKDSSCDAP